MIQRYDGAKAEKAASNVPLPKGAYVAKIRNAEVMEYNWGAQLVIAFDIAEGEYTDFFAKQYRANQNEDKKWKGNYRLTIPEEGSPYYDGNKRQFNNFIYAMEASNDGYHFDWDETKLKGNLLGVLFRNREWELNGQTGWTTECASVIDLEAVRSGDFRLPKDKPLQNNGQSAGYSAPAASSVDFAGNGIDELPF